MAYFEGIQDMLNEQVQLAKSLKIEDQLKGEPKLVAGFHQAYVGETMIVAGVICKYVTMEVVERQHIIRKADVPYIAGYVAYRVGPVIIDAFKQFKKNPDVILVNGNGIIHPRKVGIASYVGIVLQKPSVGVARTQFCGELKDDKVFVDGEMRGFRVRLSPDRQIFISPGHMLSIDMARKIVLNCIKSGNHPEPLRLADLYAEEVKAKYEKDAAKGSSKKAE